MMQAQGLVHQPRRALSATEIVTPPRRSSGLEAQRRRRSTSRIEKTFTFANYYETIAFVNALAFIANALDHHPDLRCTTTAAWCASTRTM
jgi:4a-hydroxytetrahydrobiopterin dehydratase